MIISNSSWDIILSENIKIKISPRIKMSTIIDNQNVSLNQIVLPLGTGILTNTSPSLPPILGSVAMDVTDTNHAYIGSGSVWWPLSGGVTSATGAKVTNITLTSAGQPSVTGCTLNVQAITSGSGGVSTQVMLSLTINNASIAVTGLGTWATPIGVIPVNFRPAVNTIFPLFQTASLDTNNYIISYFSVNSNGSISLFSPAASGNQISWDVASCIYAINL